MERKFLLVSTFVTIGFAAFLSGYLLMPQTRQNFANQNLGKQAGLITDRFSDKIEAGSSKNNTPNTLSLSSRKFLTFVQPFSDSKKIVAVANSGDIIEVDLANLTEKVVYTGQISIVEAILSPAGDSVIYSFYNTASEKKWVFGNLKTGNLTEIEGELKSASFSLDGDQTAYLVNNKSGRELLIAKDRKIIKRAFKTRLDVTAVSWPSEEFLSITSYDKDGYGDLFVLKEDGALNKILSYQYGLSVKWSPSAEKLIFSVKDETNSDNLFYKDIENSSAAVTLDINSDASKCVWPNEEAVICGVKNQAKVRDEFYRINIADGTKTLVATPSINLLVKELTLNRSRNILFVLNDIDSKLYALKLATSN